MLGIFSVMGGRGEAIGEGHHQFSFLRALPTLTTCPTDAVDNIVPP